MGRFIAIDYYYGVRELLVETDDLMTAYKACLKRVEDTDGECAVEIHDKETTPVIEIYGIQR